MNRIFKISALIFAIVFSLVFAGSIGGAAQAYDVPEPQGQYWLDQCGVIKDTTKSFITERNKNLEANCSGAQMCVVVVDSIGYADIEEYAYDVFSTWKIGRQDEDNGVLILFVIGGDNYWIMPGMGFERTLNTEVLNGVINVYCEPDFAGRDYDSAIYKTFSRLNELICQQYGANPLGEASGSGTYNPGGSGQPISGYNAQSHHGWSCSDASLPHYSCRSCGACNACGSCAACSVACASCSGCGSCTGFWSIILVVIIIYVILQVLRGMGRMSYTRRPSFNTAFGTRYHSAPRQGGPRPGGAGRNPGSPGRTFTGGGRPGGSGRTFTGGSKPGGSGGFSGGGGRARSGGAGRSFGGFRGGGGTTRGGGTGRR